MAKALITEGYLDGIADAIRDMLGTEATYLPSEMAAAIRGVEAQSYRSAAIKSSYRRPIVTVQFQFGFLAWSASAAETE